MCCPVSSKKGILDSLKWLLTPVGVISKKVMHLIRLVIALFKLKKKPWILNQGFY
jgi:hypothetical protein